MEEVKKGFLSMLYGIYFSKIQCFSTADERDRMSRVLYVSVIGFIMYVMISIRSDVLYALSMISRY